jgi:hypothetical protein
MTEEEIEANAASDPDNPPWTEDDFRNARLVRPGSAAKPVIWVHVDEDVRRWVHERAGDTDRMINDLLRAAMQKERARDNAECAGPGTRYALRGE